MKKLIAAILAILMLLPLIAGCTPTPAPETNAPETNAPETDAPETDAPETDAPETEAPETDAPETEAPETEAPETDAPETDAPETDAPETEAPETDAPETDAPETDAPETDAPETDAPETDAPETDAPETDAPETDAPETDAPETDAPAVDPITTATESPIKDYDFEKFVPEDKKDPDCTVGFVLQTRKYTYNSNDILVIHVTNTTDTDYSMRLTVKYTDKNGDTIEGFRDTYPDFGAGWDNYYVYTPDFSFESYNCTLSISAPCENSVTKYLTDGSLTYTTKTAGRAWIDPATHATMMNKKDVTAAAANFIHTNSHSESLVYVASYVLFDKEGNVIFLDNTQIPAVAAPGESVSTALLERIASNTSSYPKEFSGTPIGIVAYRSVLSVEDAAAQRIKATAEETGKYTFEASNGVTLPYRLYIPCDYDSSREYPVLGVFHGHGAQGTDNEKQLADIKKLFGDENSPAFDCIIFAPQCPPGGWWRDENVDAIAELLDYVCEQFSIDSQRHYVTGFSMGGCATWNLLCRHPEKISAAIPAAYHEGFLPDFMVKDAVIMNSYYPDDSDVFSKNAFPREMLEIPIYYIFGTDDELIPVDDCRDVVKSFTSAGAKLFRYDEISGKDHGTLGASYISKYNNYEPLHWLLEQRRETE